VGQVRLSVEAENDIDGFAEFTSRTWGWRQTDLYLSRIEECLELWAENPSIGRACDSIRQGLRRFEIGWHTIFYLSEPKGILVARILHQQMLPTRNIGRYSVALLLPELAQVVVAMEVAPAHPVFI
jgi:toxin ParE1/3/4